NNMNDTIGALTLTGSQVTTGSGTLTLGGDLTVNPSSITVTVSGKLALSTTSMFTVPRGTPRGADLNVSAVVSGGGGFTKAGTGIMTLSGSAANTYGGTTTVSAGELDLSKTAGINAVPSGFVVNGGVAKLVAADQIADSSAV